MNAKRLAPLRVLGGSLDDGQSLLIHETYLSIQGESSYAGKPCVFVRTTACHMRCSYCDTRHAFVEGVARSVDEVFAAVHAYGVPLVQVTGGEPLLQPGVLPLMRRLADAGHTVLLETSGSLDISPVDPRVVRIVDFKTPASKEEGSNLWSNVECLTPQDEVKFVILGRSDYEWARDRVVEYRLASRCQVLMGVAFDCCAPKDLVEWVLRDGLTVRVQLQMHKYIWPADRRGV